MANCNFPWMGVIVLLVCYICVIPCIALMSLLPNQFEIIHSMGLLFWEIITPLFVLTIAIQICIALIVFYVFPAVVLMQKRKIKKGLTFMFIPLTVTLLSMICATKLDSMDSREWKKETLQSEIKSYGIKSSVTYKFDQMHLKFKCCGIESFKDWSHLAVNSGELPGNISGIPLTCLRNDKKNRGKFIHTEGCLKEIKALEKRVVSTVQSIANVKIIFMITVEIALILLLKAMNHYEKAEKKASIKNTKLHGTRTVN